MRTKILSSSLVLLFTLLLSACGYHLRGAVDLPEDLRSVYISGASTALHNQFRIALESSSVQLVPSQAAAATVITISNEDILKRDVSLGAGGRANQFSLEYRLNYEVTDAKGNVLLNSQSVQVRREYFNNQIDVLAKDNEEQTIRGEMYQQAVRSMLNQVRTRLKNKNVNAP